MSNLLDRSRVIRVTVELVPYGAEAMAKTIAELCIETTNKTAEATEYEAAGYIVHTDNKIEDYATKLKIFQETPGVLNLIKEILNQDKLTTDQVNLAEDLIKRTRLFAETQKED